MWSLVFSLFDVSWVMPSPMINLLSCWKDNLAKEKKQWGDFESYSIVLYVAYLKINHCFEGNELYSMKLKFFFCFWEDIIQVEFGICCVF